MEADEQCEHHLSLSLVGTDFTIKEDHIRNSRRRHLSYVCLARKKYPIHWKLQRDGLVLTAKRHPIQSELDVEFLAFVCAEATIEAKYDGLLLYFVYCGLVPLAVRRIMILEEKAIADDDTRPLFC